MEKIFLFSSLINIHVQTGAADHLLDHNDVSGFLKRQYTFCEIIQRLADAIFFVQPDVHEECCVEGCDNEEMMEDTNSNPYDVRI